MKRTCIRHLAVAFLIVLSVSTMFGCAATQVAIEKRNLDVQTKMSETIFLDPVGPDKKTVFIDIKNTSDKEVNIVQDLSAAIAGKGYRCVQDPNQAHYLLQGNILSVGKVDPSALQSVMAGGYGGAMFGGVVGAGIGAATGQSWGSMAAGGIIGGIAGFSGGVWTSAQAMAPPRGAPLSVSVAKVNFRLRALKLVVVGRGIWRREPTSGSFSS